MPLVDSATPFYRSKLHLTALFSFLLGLVLGLSLGAGLGLSWTAWEVAGLVLVFLPLFRLAKASAINAKPDAINPKDREQLHALQAERSRTIGHE